MIARDKTIELLSDLVRIPSVNPHLDPAHGTGEAEIAAFVVEWLTARGVDAWIEEAEPGRPNVTARVGGGMRSGGRGSDEVDASAGPGSGNRGRPGGGVGGAPGSDVGGGPGSEVGGGPGSGGGGGPGDSIGAVGGPGIGGGPGSGAGGRPGSNVRRGPGSGIGGAENVNGPVLAICAHLDTVAADSMSIPPFDPAVAEGRLHGRGSYDMKGGVAAAMAAAASLAQSPLDGTLLLALVADEEYASAGAADWVRRHRADACIVTEPSELRLILAHKGFMWIEIETTGRAAHGSRFDLGESAIARMAPIITALHKLDASTLRGRNHPLTGPASLHAAVVEGGSGWSTYADTCRLRVERRTIPREHPDDVFDEIAALVRRVDPAAEARRVFERAPSTCHEDEEVARAVRDAGTSVLGTPPAVAGVAYWMDAAVFTEAGIPTVNIGPSGEGAHAAVEWVDVESVVTCARILAEAAQRFFLRAR